MATVPTLDLANYLLENIKGRTSADQWRWFWTRWGGGSISDPESFDADGLQVGPLGYYDVTLQDGSTIYLPCLERFSLIMLDAISASPNLVARMKGRSVPTVLAPNQPAPGSVLVLPVIDRAPTQALTSSFQFTIPWGDNDRFHLQAIRRSDGLEIRLSYDD